MRVQNKRRSDAYAKRIRPYQKRCGTFPRAAGVIVHLEIEKTKGMTEVQDAAFVPVWTDQSLGSGGKSFRTLPMKDVLDNPGGYELISQADLFKLNRAWEYAIKTLKIHSAL